MSEEQAHIQWEAEKKRQHPHAPHPHALPPRPSTPHPAARLAPVASATNTASKIAVASVTTDGEEAQNPDPDPDPAATATDDEATPVQTVPLEATWAEHFAKHAETRSSPRVRPKSLVRCQSSTHHPGGYHYGDYAVQADGAALEGPHAVRAARSEGTCSPGSGLASDYFTAPEDAGEDSDE